MTAIDTLRLLGFEDVDVQPYQELSDQIGMSANGHPHTVIAVLTKGQVTALIEKNVHVDVSDGVEIAVMNPAVLIMESPRGRTCIPNHDAADADTAALISAITEDLS